MTLQHKLIRIIEQPSIFKELANGIKPGHRKSYLLGQQFLGKLNMLIDVGANKGEVINAFRYSNPSIKVIAFEPNKDFYNDLMTEQYYPIGLWNKNTKLTFNVDTERKNSTASSFLAVNDFKPEKRQVEVKRFDSFNFKIEHPCFLKIDVEGAEYQVLQGFGDRLKEMDMIQLEFKHFSNIESKRNLGKIFSLLEKYKFYNFKQINLTYEDKEQKVLGKSDLVFWKNKK